ncbi:MAG: hypothetical protein HY808_08380 [Nitrospirae bacterium]|nr:hypothetical protein [Nitrospirota bacterium]
MNRKSILAAIIIAFSVAISLITISLQRQNAPVCHYDGENIMPVYEVDIEQKDRGVLKFCSVYCALEWFKRNNTKSAFVTVTDELTGEKLDASLAFFVESDVISVAATRNRMHVFKDKHHAQAHGKQYNGKSVLNPFNMN